MKLLIVLATLAAVATATINHGWPHAHAEHINQPQGIPNPHPAPLHHHGYDHTSRIHYDHSYIPHPHLIGVEHAVHHLEPAVAPVHGHGHGHGW